MERGGPLELPEWPVDWTIHDVPSKEHNELAVMGLQMKTRYKHIQAEPGGQVTT